MAENKARLVELFEELLEHQYLTVANVTKIRVWLDKLYAAQFINFGRTKNGYTIEFGEQCSFAVCYCGYCPHANHTPQ